MGGVRKDGITLVDSGGGGGTDVSIVGPLGSQPAADSVSVAIASDQLPLPVSATIDPTGLATEDKQDDQIVQLADIVSALDVALSTRASEVTLSSVLALLVAALDTTLSSRASQATLASVLGQLDVALSTRASQATLASVLAALDVALSTRGSEATLADIRTALQIIDDWDEGDRAKVNPIAGQAGVQGDTGTVNALTQRVVLATDVNPPSGIGHALTATPLQVTASGDTTILASSTCKLVRVEISNSHATTPVVAGIKIGAGSVFGKRYLPALGGALVTQFDDGYLQVTAQAIIINLSAAGQVEATIYTRP